MSEEKTANVETFGSKPEEAPAEEVAVEEAPVEEVPEKETASIEEVPSNGPPECIKKEDLDKINQLGQRAENVSMAIGSVEIQKSQMILQATALRNQIEQSARESLLNAGIKESDLEKYKVAIEDGKIVPSDQVNQVPPQS